jgi:hypothetical protein
LSVYLLVYPVWSIAFGAVIWRGVPVGAVDVRLAFEKSWPVIEWAEWVYVSVYLVPLVLPWLVGCRSALRRFAIDLWLLTGGCALIYLAVPVVAWPRLFEPTSLAGRLLAWETSRADFAAASLPSFHVLWSMLGARLLASRGLACAIGGWTWAIAVMLACMATGTHAIADVAVAVVLFPIAAAERSPVRRLIYALAGFLLKSRPRIRPTTSPSPIPPTP